MNNNSLINFIFRKFKSILKHDAFEIYQEWRNVLFEYYINVYKNKDIESIRKTQKFNESLGDDVDYLFDLNLVHEDYKDNIKLSIQILINNLNTPEMINDLINIIDKKHKPKQNSRKVFIDDVNKGMCGIFAYVLKNSGKCSEKLSLLISSQVFGIKSKNTVYSLLKNTEKIIKDNNVPLILKLILFGYLFKKNINWNLIKPRAKQQRSISELKIAINGLNELRQKYINEELLHAQQILKRNPKHFGNIIDDDFIDSIINFEAKRPKIDDELTFAILFASYFGNKSAYSLL